MGKIMKPTKKCTKYGLEMFFTSNNFVRIYEGKSSINIIPEELKPLAEFLLKYDAYLKQQKKEKK